MFEAFMLMHTGFLGVIGNFMSTYKDTLSTYYIRNLQRLVRTLYNEYGEASIDKQMDGCQNN